MPRIRVRLVSRLASLLPGLTPAALQSKASQHAGLTAAYGASAQPLLTLTLATGRGMPQPCQHLPTPARQLALGYACYVVHVSRAASRKVWGD